MLGDGLQLALTDERTHVGAVREGVAEPHGLRAGGEPLHEVVGDRLVDVQPLDGDAELSGGGEAGADGTGGGLLHVGVLEDQHGVLAAELQRDADQAGGRALGDLAAGARGAGERDVVGVLDDLGPDDRSVTEDDLEHLGGQPGLDQQVTGPERGQRGLRVGLHHEGVPGDERGQRIADGELERVVPRRDLADDTTRLPQLGDLGQRRNDTGVPLRLQVRGRPAPVVPGGDGDRLHLLVGVQPGLAGLQLDEVEDLRLPLEHEVVEAEEDGGPGPDGGGGPGGLGGAGPLEGGRDVLGRGLGQVGQLLPGERGVVRGTAGADDTSGQLGDHLGCHHIGSRAHTRGGGGHGVGTEGAAEACESVESVMRARVCPANRFGYPSVIGFHTPHKRASDHWQQSP